MDGSEAKRLVSSGYDQVATAYLASCGRSEVRARKLAELIDDLPPRAKVLDLGCGAGSPIAATLSELGFDVTGVDVSRRQIELARRFAPRAKFIVADMTAARFPAESFDAAVAFYSISHIPRAEHRDLFERIAAWLRRGGLFVASFGKAEGEWIKDWFGAPMFFSHHDPNVTKRLIVQAGFCLAKAETLAQDDEEAEFLWLSARKR